MRLTHIKLAGFKSFVDPTTIAVPGQLVAVIGPNGCGKSNVIDAVRWVLGEASAKQLRGESMQDVIFNGAATRRPAPRAMVELVFNNADGALQGPWGQYTEIAIKRQLTRQGESSYYINNQAVRRRDITDLFLGTGVGARGYAVIEQGMISRIIEARPEELRAYIEEAAGVSKYKERRRETENRLKDTREHLQRLADLQNELNRQVDKLQRQAKTAKRYQNLQAELAAQQNLLDYVQWQQALTDADAATEQHRQHKARQDDITAQIDALAEAIAEAQHTEAAQQQQVHELGNRRALLREQWARLEEQIRHRQNLQQRLERDRAQAQAQLQRLQQDIRQWTDEITALDSQIEEQAYGIEEWALQTAEHEAALPDIEQAAHNTALARQHQQDEHSRLQRELALQQQRGQHAAHSQAQLLQRQQRLQQEMAGLNLPDTAEVAAARSAADDGEATVAELEAALAQCEAEYAQRQAHTRQHREQQQQLHGRLLALQAQQSALAALLPTAEGDDFWTHTDCPDAPALWQQLDADAQWRHAITVALGRRLQTRAVAEHFVPPHPLPEAAAAWVNRPAAASGAAPATDSLCHRARGHGVFQAALALWLTPWRCCDNLETALARQAQLADGECWITPEGHVIDAAGVLLYHVEGDDDLLQRRAQLVQIQEEQNALAPLLAETEAALAECQQAESRATETRIQLQQRLKQAQQQLQTALSRAADLLARTNQGQLRHEHIRLELQQIEQEQAQQQQTGLQAETEVNNLAAALAALTEAQQSLYTKHQQQQQALKQAQLAVLESKRQHGLAEMALQRLQQQRQHIWQQQQAAERQSEEWQERQSELALAYAHDEHDAEQQAALESLHAAIDAANEAYDAAQNALGAIQQQQQARQRQQQALNHSLPGVQEAVQAALLQQQEALLHAKRFHDHLQQHQADIDALSRSAATAPAGDDLARNIADLAHSIHALGAVNLAALDELAEADERSRYYAGQQADVEAAMALLQEAIAQIDEETKHRFKTTFDAVNAKVQRFFPTLFGGGEAQLTMVGDDLLSAGVSIMARPPGKKNSTIHLLSGGEKALTAMSLVFALFSLNPAPFCLLDEVDAPLDDANTGRFCQLVQEMSAQTQFLYISHNRLTMEMAKQLVGVTMQEKGVSRIVAVDIRQALDMAEA